MKMRKLLPLLLALVMVFGLVAACGGEDAPASAAPTDPADPAAPASTAAPPDAEPEMMRMELTWLVYTETAWPGILTDLAYDSWRELGVDLTIELMDFNTVISRSMDPPPGEKEFDVYCMGFSLSIDPDISGIMWDYDAFEPGGFNSNGLYNERMQELLYLGKTTFDQAERQKIYQEVSLLANELVSAVVIANRYEIWAVANRVQGVEIGTYYEWWRNLNKATVTEGDNYIKFGTTGIDGKFLPVLSNNLYDSYVASLVFEGLISNDFQGAPIPHLATWEISNENLTYTFTLQDGIKFSDGTPLTTADVEFTYKTIAHPDYDGPRSYSVNNLVGYAAYRAGETDVFEGIQVIDDKTISFTFEDGMASPANIWEFGYGIMPKHIYDFNEYDELLDKISQPVGSGWFLLDEYRPMEIVRFSTNKNYWNPADMPSIDGVIMLEVPDQSLEAAFINGDIDIAQPETNRDNYDSYMALDVVNAFTVLANGYQYMEFNTLNPRLEDVRVRQALLYALPRQAYVDINFGPLGSVGMAPISPASWGYPSDVSQLNDYALDLEKAAQLMEEAGWTKGPDGIYQKPIG